MDKRTFTDAEGRVWVVKYGYQSIKDVRDSELDFDLGTVLAGEADGLQRLGADPMLFIDLLYVMCRNQRPDVSDVDFGEAMRGDALEEAQQAFLKALMDFCPSRQRKVLETMVAQSEDIQEEIITTVQTAMKQRVTSGEPESSSQRSPESSDGNGTACGKSTGQPQKFCAVNMTSPQELRTS